MTKTKLNPGTILITTLIIINILLAVILTYYLASHKSNAALADPSLKRISSKSFLSKEKAQLSHEPREIKDGINITGITTDVPKDTVAPPSTQTPKPASSETKPEETPLDKQPGQASSAPTEETSSIPTTNSEEHKEGLRITNLVFAKSVENWLPSGEGAAFHFSSGKVYCWMEVENATPPTTLKHIYSFKDKTILEVELQVRYPHMRLWSYKTISENIFVGKWRVDIADNEGKILTTGYFDITD